ncbi:MAG: porin family protein [Bauldia sp.]|nr:porin family protein [Bauldia sp.]
MKKFVLAAAATAVFAGGALAADLPPPPPPPEAQPAFSWEHTIYIGLQGGYGVGYKDWLYNSGLGGDNIHQVRGWLAGVQAGINVQRANFVIGTEADWNWSNVEGSALCPPPDLMCTSQINWIATWTARAGVMAGRTLLYVEGGFAAANETFVDTYTGIVPPIVTAETVMNYGWTVGGGVELKVGSSMAIDLEYSYVNFGTDDYIVGASPLTVTQSLHMLRFGVNRLF